MCERRGVQRAQSAFSPAHTVGLCSEAAGPMLMIHILIHLVFLPLCSCTVLFVYSYINIIVQLPPYDCFCMW